MASFDTVVIGAGVIGLSTAWRLAQRGLKVLVLERDKPGAGASGVAAGMLAPVTEASFGEEQLLRLNLMSARRFPSFLEELQEASETKVAFDSEGTLYSAFDRDQLEGLQRLHDFQLSLGLEVEWLSYEHAREIEPALHPSLRGAVLAPGDTAVDPRVLLDALTVAAERTSCTIRSGAEVRSLQITADKLDGIFLETGERIDCGGAVLAAGCWSGRIDGVPAEVRSSIRPVKGQVLRLRPVKQEPALLVNTVRTEEVYLVPRLGGVVVGATMEEKGYEVAVTAGAVYELLRSAAEAVPGVRELEMVEASAGLRPASLDNRPLLGPTSVEGLFCATGHFRNGVLLAPITADTLVRMITQPEIAVEIEPFLPVRFAR